MLYKNNSSLRTRMVSALLLVAIFSAITVTVGTTVYFFQKIKTDATNTMKKNMDVAQAFYQDGKEAVLAEAVELAAEPIMKIYVGLDANREKIMRYLLDVAKAKGIYHFTVADRSGNSVAMVGKKGSLINGRSLVSQSTKAMIERAFDGESIAVSELIPSSDGGQGIIAMSGFAPIVYENKVVGVMVVRHILNENQIFFATVANLLEVDVLLYQQYQVLNSVRPIPIESKYYANVMETGTPSGESVMRYGKMIAQYQPVLDYAGKPIGVLAVALNADKYVDTFIGALFSSSIIMLFCLFIAMFLGNYLANNLITPIQELLKVVDKISSGDLSSEAKIIREDEIGKLSNQFNAMRINLKDKISAINNLNTSLGKTIEQRTEDLQDILERMKKYLPSQLYDIISGDDHYMFSDHKRRKLTIFFSEIQGFTTITDSMESEELSKMLNHYLDEMAKIALKWGGTLDKFIGDAIMVFFGAPEFIDDKTHALRAAYMAMEMRELRLDWLDGGVSQPLHIRMGINTGYCTVGNFGSENRMDYTIIGGQVNIASRLETSAPTDGILISHETFALIQDQIQCEYQGEIQAKGVHSRIKTYQILGKKNQENIITQYFRKTPEGNVYLKNLLLNDASEKNNLLLTLKLATRFVESQKIEDI